MPLHSSRVIMLLVISVLVFGTRLPTFTQGETTIFPSYNLTQTMELSGAKPYWVALDEQGRIYMTDAGNKQVWIFNRDGQNIENLTGFYDPNGIDVFMDRIYVTDFATHNVSLICNGTLVASHTVLMPRGVKVAPNGNVYAVCPLFDRIYIYDQNLTLIDIILGVKAPMDVAFAPDGRIYVTCSMSKNISVFSSNHVFLGSFAQGGTGLGGLSDPCGIEVDPQGYIFVAEWGPDHINIYSPDHQFVQSIEGIDQIHDVAVDDLGYLYAPSVSGENITVWQTLDLGDHSGPTITNIVISPLNPVSGQPVMVTAALSDMSGIHNATLTYAAPGVTGTVLLSSGNDRYLALLPAFPGGIFVNLILWAEDKSSAHHNTTVTMAFNVGYAPLIHGIDPILLVLGGIGLASVANALVLLKYLNPRKKAHR